MRATPRAMSQQPEKSMYSWMANRMLAASRLGPFMEAGLVNTKLVYTLRLSAITIFLV